MTALPSNAPRSITVAELERTEAIGGRDLHDLLLSLERYGKPCLMRLARGWHCEIEVNVSATGAKFYVRSEYGHATPLAATVQCAERMRDALQSIHRGST